MARAPVAFDPSAARDEAQGYGQLLGTKVASKNGTVLNVMTVDNSGNYISPGAGSGSGNTAPATAAGTSATTANPVQGVTGGVPFGVVSNTLAQDSSLTAILNALKAQVEIATTLFTDNSGAYYVRRDSVNEGTGTITVTFTDAQGNAATPGAGLRPVAGNSSTVAEQAFDATASGTGYAVGDIIIRAIVRDPNANVTTIWFNATQGTVLSTAPAIGNLREQSMNGNMTITANGAIVSTTNALPVTNTTLPPGAATSAKQPAFGTTASPSADIVSIQPVSGGAAFPVSGNVGVTSLPAIPAGGNAIGTVIVTSAPALAAGSNAIGTVGVTSLPALSTGTNAIGTVGVTALPALPNGSNAIGTVGVTALPALPTGANTIGNVGINSPLPTGTNALGTVGVTALPALAAGSNAIGTVGVTALPALPSGSNAIGTVSLNAALPAGSNTIGSVTQLVGGSAISAANPMPISGNVGGRTSTPRQVLTVTSGSAYAAGNVVGGVVTFTNALLTAGSGILNSITLDMGSAQTVPFRVYIFTSAPSSTFTDKTAPSWSAADRPKLVGSYLVTNYDSSLGAQTIYNLDGIAKTIAAGATTLYAVIIVNGAPTFASTSDVAITLGISQD